MKNLSKYYPTIPNECVEVEGTKYYNIPNFEPYKVSTKGGVVNKTNRIKRNGTYNRQSLSVGGYRKWSPILELMIKTFYPNIGDDEEVGFMFKDGNKRNFNLDNLKLITPSTYEGEEGEILTPLLADIRGKDNLVSGNFVYIENHYISNKGNIIVFRSGEVIKMSKQLDKDGYEQIHLPYKGRQLKRRVHRLVGFAFIEGFEEVDADGNLKIEINHIVPIKDLNNVENLEWCSHPHNMKAYAKWNKLKKENEDAE
jgi:hypothetical protein